MIKIAALALVACLAAPAIASAAPGDDEDRYGPPPAPFVDPAAADSFQRTLTWPGKTAASPRQTPQAARTSAPQAYVPAPYAPAAYVAAASPSQSVAALPTSIYAPPPSPLM